MNRYEAWKQALAIAVNRIFSNDVLVVSVLIMIAIVALEVNEMLPAKNVPERCFKYADAPHDLYVCMSEYASGAASYVSDEVKEYWYGN